MRPADMPYDHMPHLGARIKPQQQKVHVPFLKAVINCQFDLRLDCIIPLYSSKFIAAHSLFYRKICTVDSRTIAWGILKLLQI